MLDKLITIDAEVGLRVDEFENTGVREAFEEHLSSEVAAIMTSVYMGLVVKVDIPKLYTALGLQLVHPDDTTVAEFSCIATVGEGEQAIKLGDACFLRINCYRKGDPAAERRKYRQVQEAWKTTDPWDVLCRHLAKYSDSYHVLAYAGFGVLNHLMDQGYQCINSSVNPSINGNREKLTGLLTFTFVNEHVDNSIVKIGWDEAALEMGLVRPAK